MQTAFTTYRMFPLAFLLLLVCPAKCFDPISLACKLMRNLIETGIAIKNDILAHIPSFAEKSDFHDCIRNVSMMGYLLIPKNDAV